MTSRQKLQVIAAVSGGFAGGVAGGVGAALQLHPVYYVLIAVVLGLVTPVVLYAIWPDAKTPLKP